MEQNRAINQRDMNTLWETVVITRVTQHIT